MADPENNYKQFLLSYLIDDSIVRKSIAEQSAVLAFELLARIRIFGDYLFNKSKCTMSYVPVELPHFPEASIFNFNRIHFVTDRVSSWLYE